jgi:L-asparaginase / beta-aspartyl-peptidase
MNPLVVSTANARVGIAQATELLRAGGRALDAVIAGIAVVEANPEEHSVGYSGLPNLLGEVELDASVMDGRTLHAGAVGAVNGYQDAALLARKVMEELPHVMLVGAGAGRFASEMDLAPVDLLTDHARRVWASRLQAAGDDQRDVVRTKELVARVANDPEFPEPPHGTVNLIARDAAGDIACGVSSSGWAWKYPGRLGDSPIIGAGNYADNRWGAAACSGRGEMALRCATAHSVVTFMRFGLDLPEALDLAMRDLVALDDPYQSEVNVIALDAAGNHAAASTTAGKTYLYMAADMSEPVEAPRTHVPF